MTLQLATESKETASGFEVIVRCPQCERGVCRAGDSFQCDRCQQFVRMRGGFPSFCTGDDAFYEHQCTNSLKLPLIDRIGWPWRSLVYLDFLCNERHRRNRFFRRAVKRVPGRGTVLDIGCGGGMEIWKQLGCVVGLSNSLTGLTQARRIYDGCVHADLNRGLPFPDGSFDVIAAIGVVGHFDEEGRNRLLREIHRCLAPGGRFIGVIETIGQWFEQYQRRYPGIGPAYIDAGIRRAGHIGLEPPRQALQRLAAVGFDCEQLELLGAYPSYVDGSFTTSDFESFPPPTRWHAVAKSISRVARHSWITTRLMDNVFGVINSINLRRLGTDWADGLMVVCRKAPSMDAAGDAFTQEWEQVRGSLKLGAIEAELSPLWQVMIKDFSLSGGAGDVARKLFSPNERRSYGFVRTDTAVSALIALERARLWTLHAGSAVLKRVGTWLWHNNLFEPAFGSLMAYPRFLMALKRQGLWEGYRALCRSLDVSPVSFNTAKLYYVASLVRGVRSELPRQEPLSVLEVGGGTGNLAVILGRLGTLGPLSRYVIVDLPEMALNAALVIRHFLPEVPIRFTHLTGFPEGRIDPGVTFVFPGDIDRLPENCVDLSLNIDSFQEMSADQVSVYLALMQRATHNRGLLITLNRRRVYHGKDNNPLLYAYDPRNDIVRWESDPYMTYTLNLSGVDDHHLVRIERVNKADDGS